MNYYEKTLKFILLGATLVFFAVLFLIFVNNFGFFEMSIVGETQALQNQNIAAFAVMISIALFFLSGILFVRLKIHPAYLAWRKFALWYLPIVAIFILSAGGGSNGFNPGYGMDSESLTFFFSGLFAFISLILIIYKSVKLKGK
jgi:hypothetical protein